MAAEIPGTFAALQFDNPANPDFHYATTARETLGADGGTRGCLCLRVSVPAALSPASPASSRNKTRAFSPSPSRPRAPCCRGAQPGHHKVEGIGVSFIPRTFGREWCDEIIAVKDPEAFAMVKRLAAEEGLLSGSSGGAAVDAAVQIATRLGKGKRVATIIPDSAERYLSKKIFEGGL